MGNKSKARYPFERSQPESSDFITPRNRRRLDRKPKQRIADAAMLAMAEAILAKPKARAFRLLDPRSWFRRAS